jgi:hypothetical protein
MLEIKLSEQERNNLLVFLKRVNLTGEEVPEFVNLTNKIGSAKKIEKKSE